LRYRFQAGAKQFPLFLTPGELGACLQVPHGRQAAQIQMPEVNGKQEQSPSHQEVQA